MYQSIHYCWFYILSIVKAEIAPKLNGQNFIQVYFKREEKPELTLNPTPLKQKFGGFLRTGVEVRVDHLCLLISQRKSKLSTSFLKGDSLITCSKETLHFKEMVPRSLRKTILGSKASKILNRFTSPKGIKRICNYIFSKVNT